MVVRDNNVIDILTASDDRYSVMLGAMIKSIEIHATPKNNINITILDANVTRDNKIKLINTITSDKINIEWKPVNSQLIKRLNAKGGSVTITPHYYRLLMPWIVPETIQKLIYLDCDTLILEDIAELWKTDVTECIIGAVENPWSKMPDAVQNYMELGIDVHTKYFNSGVMLININSWKSQNISDRVMEVTSMNEKHVYAWDQYGLNVVLANKWKELDQKWNQFAEDGCEKSSACIVHFLAEKPIDSSYPGGCRDLFFKYLDQTEWMGWRP